MATLLSTIDAPGTPRKRSAEEAKLTGNLAGIVCSPSSLSPQHGYGGARAHGCGGGRRLQEVHHDRVGIRVDESHVPGNILVEKHSDKMTDECKKTRACLERSNNMEPLGVAGYDMINGRCRASTCIMVMMFCAFTAKALLHRLKEGGFNVKEEGKNVGCCVQDDGR